MSEERPPLQHGVGDVVTIRNRWSGHGFLIGQEVKIIRIDEDGDYEAESLTKNDHRSDGPWFIGDEDLMDNPEEFTEKWVRKGK